MATFGKFETTVVPSAEGANFEVATLSCSRSME